MRKRQAAMDALVNRLTKKLKKHEKETLIAFGRGEANLALFGKVRGGVKDPAKELMLKAARRAVVISSDEYMTSPVCHSCRNHLSGFVAPTATSAGRKNLCYCPNSPTRFWNRDVGASFSMGWRYRR